MIAVALITALVSADGAPAAADGLAALEVGVDLEYSTFLDVYRRAMAMNSGAESTVGRFGGRVHLAWKEGWLALGAALSLYPGTGVCGSVDLYLSYTKRWRRLGLRAGGGAGTFFTQKSSGVPTWTDRVAGPALHLGGQLRWFWSKRFFAAARVAIYVYPLQPLAVVAVGVDPRWSLGVGATL